VLNNNHSIIGYILDVNHNKFSVLSVKKHKILSILYKSVRRIDLIDEQQIELFKQLRNKIEEKCGANRF